MTAAGFGWRCLCSGSTRPFMHLETWLSPVKALLVAALVFIPFERLAPMHGDQRLFRRGSATDVLTGLVNGLVLYATLLIALATIDRYAAAAAPQLRVFVATRSVWMQVVVAVVVGDLGVYGMHRLMHTVPWLWRFHSVHHSAEEMDWLVGFRFHAVDLLLARLASIGPIVALNVVPEAVAAFVAIFGWQSWLVHANVRIPYGPLRWVLVSPEFHHWHHSAEREAFNTNYSNVFAWWDVMFRTVHLPPGRQPLRYGVEEHVPAGYVDRFLYGFRGRRPEPSLPAAVARYTHASGK
jgi:sterol desaturase/sphingolipid hydroxylase (fatty acid hydroxylase superfamily)